MNSKLDGPLVSAFEADTTGVIKQEFVTYRIREGMLVKETTSRRFQGNDYHDVSSVEPLLEVE
jgi:hypothetical protein|tara:strand:- start:3969 stop:4157 length:189 start_codon:yes stop_codon:yes gene_type:complete